MGSVLQWLPVIGGGVMVLFGLVGLFRPVQMLSSMQIQLNSPLAHSEVRAVFGAMNLGLGLSALVLADAAVYTALAVAWGLLLLARFWSMAVDGTTLKDSVPAFIVDGGLCLLFALPLLFGGGA